MQKKSFLIKDLGQDLHFEFKRYALYNNTTMERLGIEAIKDKIGYQEEEVEGRNK